MSARAARSLTGYVDHAEGEVYWRPPRSEHSAAPGLFDRPFRAPAEAVTLGLEHLDRHKRDLPTQAFVFVLSDFLVPLDLPVWRRALEHRWELVPVVIQDPRLGAELPGRRRDHRPVRRSRDRARRPRLPHAAEADAAAAHDTRSEWTS